MRFYTLRVHIVSHGQNVHIAGALAVSEERSLDAVRARKQRELGRRNAGAAVVVRVDADHNRIAILKVTHHPLNLVRIDIRRVHLDRQREVDDHLLLRCRHAPLIEYRLADLERKVELGSHKALRGVLEDDVVAPELFHAGLDHLDAVYGNLLNLLAARVEDHVALQGIGRIVDVHNRVRNALDGLEGSANQVLAALREHLDMHIRRNHLPQRKQTEEVKLNLRGRRKADLDFLKAQL